MSSKTIGSRQVRFAVLTLTLFMLSVFTPLIEHNAWNNSNLEAELEPEIDEAPSWYTDAIVTNEIIIREIMIDPLGDDAGNEFVILWNNDSFPALVGGWRLADGSLSTLYTFPSEYSMMPYIPYVIAFGEGEDIESADEELLPTLLHTGSAHEHFLLSSGSLTLLDNQSNGAVIDFVAWDDGTGSPTTAEQQAVSAGQWTSGDFVDTSGDRLSAGEGLVRDYGVKDTNSSSDFVDQSQVVINEIALDIMVDDQRGEWIEILNPGAATQQIGEWEIASNNSTLYTFPEGALLLGGKSVVVHLGASYNIDEYFTGGHSNWLDGDTEVFAQLPSADVFDTGENASGDLGLYDGSSENGSIVDYVSWGLPSVTNNSNDAVNAGIWTANDTVSIDNLAENDSIGRKWNGEDTDSILDWNSSGGPDANGPTPGLLNRLSVMILDYNWSVTGAETLVVTNFGQDTMVEGWKLFNQTRESEATLPNFNFIADSTLQIIFDQGTDDIDLTDGEGTVHIGSLGTLVVGEVALLILWDGDSASGAFIDLTIFVNGQPYIASDDDTSGRISLSEAWEIAHMLGSETVAFISGPWSWLKAKAYAGLNWAIAKIKNSAFGDLGDLVDIEVAPGDGTYILWTVTFSSGGDFSIPLVVPWLSLDISISGSVTVQKTCDGFDGEGTLTVSAAVTVGRDIKFVELSISVGIRAELVYPGEMKTEDTGTMVTGKLTTIISAFASGTASIKILRWKKTVSKEWSIPLFKGSIQVTKQYPRDCDGHPDQTWREGNPDVQPPRGENNPFEPDGYDTRTGYSRVPKPGETKFMSWIVKGPDSAATSTYGSNEEGWADNTCGGCSYGEQPDGTYVTEHFIDVTIPSASNIPWEEHIVLWPEPPGGGDDDDDNNDDDEGGGGGGEPKCNCEGAPVVHDVWVGNDADIFTNRFSMFATNATNSSLNDTAYLDAPIYEIYDINITSENGWPVQLNGLNQLWAMRPDEPKRLTILHDVPPGTAAGTTDKVTITIQSQYNVSNNLVIEIFTQATEQPLDEVWVDHLDPLPRNGWSVLGGGWESGVPTQVGPPSAVTTPTLWGTNLDGNYADSTTHELLTPAMDLSDLTNAQLHFSEWFEINQGTWDLDNVNVQVVNLDTGEVFDIIIPRNGNSGENGGAWAVKRIPLREEHLLPNVAFLFTLYGDYTGNAAGWYIDDIAVVTCEIPLAEIEPINGPAVHGSYVDEGSGNYETIITNPTDKQVNNISVNWTLEQSKFKVFALEDFEQESSWNTWSVSSEGNSIGFMRDDDGGERIHTSDMANDLVTQTNNQRAGTSCSLDCDSSANVGGVSDGAPQVGGPEFSYGDNTNTSLTSPSYDLSSQTGQLWLRFIMRADLAPSDDRVTLWYSEDDGSSWSLISDWREPESQHSGWLCCAPGDWTVYMLPIANNPSSQVKFRWTVESDNRNAGEMVAIDDVALLLRTDAIILEDGEENLTLAAGASLTFPHSAQLEAVDDELTLYTMYVNLSCECYEEEPLVMTDFLDDGDARQRMHSLWVLPPIDIQITKPATAELMEIEIVELKLVSSHPLLSLGGTLDIEISDLSGGCSITTSKNVIDLQTIYSFMFNISSCSDGNVQFSATLIDSWSRTTTEQVTANLSIDEPVVIPPDEIVVNMVTSPSLQASDGAIHCDVGTMIQLDAGPSTGEGGITNWTWTLSDNSQVYGSNVSVPCTNGTIQLSLEDGIGQTDNESIVCYATAIPPVVIPPVSDISSISNSHTDNGTTFVTLGSQFNFTIQDADGIRYRIWNGAWGSWTDVSNNLTLANQTDGQIFIVWYAYNGTLNEVEHNNSYFFDGPDPSPPPPPPPPDEIPDDTPDDTPDNVTNTTSSGRGGASAQTVATIAAGSSAGVIFLLFFFMRRKKKGGRMNI